MADRSNVRRAGAHFLSMMKQTLIRYWYEP
jgi:hypothetical protein